MNPPRNGTAQASARVAWLPNTRLQCLDLCKLFISVPRHKSTLPTQRSQDQQIRVARYADIQRLSAWNTRSRYKSGAGGELTFDNHLGETIETWTLESQNNDNRTVTNIRLLSHWKFQPPGLYTAGGSIGKKRACVLPRRDTHIIPNSTPTYKQTDYPLSTYFGKSDTN
ncbi:hypothetical protein TRVA0_034S01706 [Trichomonascus vanleenenianus]|uniref:uncharacterized protein n=1 Tax=Trichomonascus vanleenenianus TaxID=2268995 RepID=UPI003ECBA69A